MLNSNNDQLTESQYEQLTVNRNEWSYRLKENKTKLRGINDEISKINDEIDKARTEIEFYLAQIRDLNKIRTEAGKTIAEMHAKLDKSKKFINSSKGYRSHESESKLLRRLKAIETKMQTARFNRDEERLLVSQAKDIAARLNTMRAIDKTRKNFSEFKSSIDKVKQNTKGIPEKKDSIKEELDKHRNAMKELVDRRNSLFEDKKNFSKELKELAEKISEADARIDQHKSKSKNERSYKVQEIVTKIKVDAQKKLDTGGKVSLDELKILLEGDKTYPR